MKLTPQQHAVRIAREILQRKPVYLDTETTGLDKNAEIVEMAIIDWDGQTLFDQLIHPRFEIPEEATRLNHITNEMVADKPDWVIAWQTIKNILSNRVIGIYNEEFDLRMIQQTHSLHQIIGNEKYRTFDVMKIYAQYRNHWDKERKRYRLFKLEEAGRFFQITIPNSHRAIDDTLLTREVLLHIAKSEIL